MKVVTVRLQTLCGCTRIMVQPYPAPNVIDVPIQDITEEGGPVTLRSRSFELRKLTQDSYGTEAEYHEVPEPK